MPLITTAPSDVLPKWYFAHFFLYKSWENTITSRSILRYYHSILCCDTPLFLDLSGFPMSVSFTLFCNPLGYKYHCDISVRYTEMEICRL